MLYRQMQPHFELEMFVQQQQNNNTKAFKEPLKQKPDTLKCIGFCCL
jgi:hypothetical protein